jgi:peptidoglycan glycosyltransferase
VNRPLRRVAVAAALLLLALVVNTNILQVGEAGSLRANPENHLPLLEEYSHPRGPIVIGGTDVAKSVATKDTLKYERTYPRGRLYAAITGFYSLVYGSTGMEHAEDGVLSGTDDRLLPERLSNLLSGRTPQGGSVVLSIDPAAQKAAAAGLGDQRGAVVAIDPSTGAILALYSSPSYDPSTLSSHDNKAITSSWKSLNDDSAQPLLDRALSATYPPGSLFKIVTASTALSTGRYTPTSTISVAPTDYANSSVPIINYGGESCGNGQTDTLIDAFAISCNVAFARLGEQLGHDALASQAQAFGVGSDLSIPLPVASSTFPTTSDDPAETERDAIGQGDVSITPLQGAMLAAGIADGGVVMKPYLVSEVRSPDESVLDRAQPTELGRAVSPSVAHAMTQLMESVVDSPSGTAHATAAIPGVEVAGKTGTAQHGETSQHLAPDVWFAAFAPADHPQVAVAVVVEDGGNQGSGATGGSVSAPIAKSVICAVLGTCS